MLKPVLAAFGLNEDSETRPFGKGLINSTWQVESNGAQYILQRVNTSVFDRPEDIDHNITCVRDYLDTQHPHYLFIAPLRAVNGDGIINISDAGHFRLFPFVPGSRSPEVATTTNEAFEAARQFGRLTNLTSGMNIQHLRVTIPHFHNLARRYEQFLQSVQVGDADRIRNAGPLISELLANANIVDIYRAITNDPQFHLRVTHHDSKISNVLFDDEGRGLCVVDLDTIMPGYFISDVGDMMRTFLSPVSEEEADFSKIEVRREYYRAIVEGYVSEMGRVLTEKERDHFFYAGQCMIFMQALRFLTDYLKGDVYYPVHRAHHNLLRAGNQLTLLKRLMEKRGELVDRG